VARRRGMPAAEMNSVLRVKKQKTDRKDAQLLLTVMMEDRFPRIWVSSPENLDVRQLLGDRHRLVQMRTRIMNQLQALAMNEGQRWKSKLWNEQGRAEIGETRVGSLGQRSAFGCEPNAWFARD
jgi:transposase